MDEDNMMDLPESWIGFHNLVTRANESIEEQDIYELDGNDLRLLITACKFIKKTHKICTGSKIMYSLLTDRKYEVNIWINKGDGLLEALSKRLIKAPVGRDQPDPTIKHVKEASE